MFSDEFEKIDVVRVGWGVVEAVVDGAGEKENEEREGDEFM